MLIVSSLLQKHGTNNINFSFVCNCEELFSMCLQTMVLTPMFLGILFSLSVNLWLCEAASVIICK